MIAVVLRGMLARKLRAVLTAVAIVLGVAMISSTYVLMDTTMRAFATSVRDGVPAKTDVSVSGKTPFGAMEDAPPPVSAALLDRSRARGSRGGGGSSRTRRSSGTLEENAWPAAASRSRWGSPPAASSARSTGSPAASRPGRGDRARRGDGKGERLRRRVEVGVAARGPLEPFQVVGILRFGGVESLGPIQILVFDLPVAQRLFDKQGLYDVIDVRSRGRDLDRARGRDRAAPAGHGRGEDTGGAGRGVELVGGRGHCDRPLRPARVRGHRPLRRLVRHLQHALDHGRAADARARDPADDRRFAPARCWALSCSGGR